MNKSWKKWREGQPCCKSWHLPLAFLNFPVSSAGKWHDTLHFEGQILKKEWLVTRVCWNVVILAVWALSKYWHIGVFPLLPYSEQMTVIKRLSNVFWELSCFKNLSFCFHATAPVLTEEFAKSLGLLVNIRIETCDSGVTCCDLWKHKLSQQQHNYFNTHSPGGLDLFWFLTTFSCRDPKGPNTLTGS